MSLHIRPAKADDLAAVLALYAQPGLDDGRVLDLAQAQAIWAQFAHYPSYRLFVAVSQETGTETSSEEPYRNSSLGNDQREQVVGSYALLIMHNLAHQGTPSAVVEDVVVHPAHQSRGIGRQLMAHAMRQAQEAGCYKLALSSNRKRAQAHAFYNALGFQPHGVSFVLNPSAPPEPLSPPP